MVYILTTHDEYRIYCQADALDVFEADVEAVAGIFSLDDEGSEGAVDLDKLDDVHKYRKALRKLKTPKDSTDPFWVLNQCMQSTADLVTECENAENRTHVLLECSAVLTHRRNKASKEYVQKSKLKLALAKAYEALGNGSPR